MPHVPRSWPNIPASRYMRHLSMMTWLVALDFRLLRTTCSRVGLINTNINKYYSILRLCQFRILEGSPRTKDQNSVCALVVLAIHSSCKRQSPQFAKVVEMNIFYNLHQHFIHSYDLLIVNLIQHKDK